MTKEQIIRDYKEIQEKIEELTELLGSTLENDLRLEGLTDDEGIYSCSELMVGGNDNLHIEPLVSNIQDRIDHLEGFGSDTDYGFIKDHK